METCCEGDVGRMIVWLGDGWCEWGKGEGDWARRRTTKLGRKIEDEVGVCEG